MINKIKKSLFTLSFLSFLVSIAYIVYIEFIKDERSKITFKITSNIELLDISTQLDNSLKVYYKDINLLENNNTLILVQLSIENTGSKSILINEFDSEDPLGFFISNGKILKASELKGSTEYINKKLSNTLLNESSIFFPSMIINPSDSISISLLLLKQKNSSFEINPKGTISNMIPFEVEYLYLDTENSIIDTILEIYEEDIFTILLNHFIYLGSFVIGIFLLALFMIFGVVVPLLTISDLKDSFYKRLRKGKIKKYKLYSADTDDKYDKVVFDYYLKNNKLEDIRNLYTDNEELEKMLSNYSKVEEYNAKYKTTEEEKEGKQEAAAIEIQERRNLEKENAFRDHYKIQEYMNNKILTKQGNINEHVKKSYDSFMKYLYKD